MCIIGYKKEDQDPIALDTLEHCWENNGDGAGYAIWNNTLKLWVVKKGFMTFNALLTEYNKEVIDKTTKMIIHFRFGTSGNKDGGNTHPFPIFESLNDMRQTRFNATYIAVHNGTCGLGEGVYSDTMVALHKFIAPIYSVMLNDENQVEKLGPALIKLMNAETASKWILTLHNKVIKFGNGWENDDNGILWSNGMYKKSLWVNRNNSLYNTGSSYNFSNRVNKRWNESSHRFDIWDKVLGKYVPEEQYTKNYPLAVVENTQKFGKVSYKGVIMAYGLKPTIDHTIAYLDTDGNIIFENDDDDVITTVMCPNCYDDNCFEESQWLHADLTCLNCGAAFNKDTGEILLIDEEISLINKEG